MNRLVTDPQEFLVSHRTSATTFLDSGYQILHTCVLQQRIMSNKTAKGLASVTEGEQTPAAAGVFGRDNGWEFTWDQQQTDIRV